MELTGIIGYGEMGSMLVRGFLSTGVLRVDEVVVSSRSKKSLDACAAAWPGIGIAPANTDLARRCRTIIIAVRPGDVLGVLHEIAPVVEGDEHIISLAAGVSLADLEAVFMGPVTRVIPTITSSIGQGTTLICHGRGVGAGDARRAERLFSPIGDLMLVEEGELPVATFLSSCGPGLLAAIIEELAGAAIRAGGLSPDRALSLATGMVTATAAYIRETGETPPDLIRHVATGGGITGVGVRRLRERLPGVLDETFAAMLQRHDALGERS
ncbi:MAG: NAD(P)-binding domain-containing protein [Methanomicrobiales archaeon]|nr:NAD(P)-binding domain-containing protein [Methanomicrobiales archaeon]